MTSRDLAIVGSGFGGSILAMIARRTGWRVWLLERGRHPRFAIGESASPLAGVLIEQLADRYDLPRLRPLAAYGPWRRAYPGVGCGLKRGFTYYRHEAGRPFRATADRANELLVAASPNDEVADTHWLRADVDHFLVQEAVALGVEYLDEVSLERADPHPDGSWTLSGQRAGRPLRLRVHHVVDATGPRGFLSRALGLRDVGFADYPATQALFTHFTGVAPCADLPDFHAPRTQHPHRRTPAPPHLRTAVPPYPPDAAALHHVFDGGWMWVLHLARGVTSAGVAMTDALAAELRLADGEPAWQRLLARHPTIAGQFAGATAIRPFTWMPRLAYRADQAAGPGWTLLPSAAAFVDPLFSTGIPLTLLGIERLARRLEGGARRGGPSRPPEAAAGPAMPVDEYAAATLAEADHTAAFVAGCYAALADFARFAAYSMFYFAAASHAEMARRLGVAPATTRFLAADRPAVARAMRRLSPARPQSPDGYATAVAAAIDPINVAGLCDPAKRNWYAVDLEDTVRAAHKLGLTPEAVAAGLAAF